MTSTPVIDSCADADVDGPARGAGPVTAAPRRAVGRRPALLRGGRRRAVPARRRRAPRRTSSAPPGRGWSWSTTYRSRRSPVRRAARPPRRPRAAPAPHRRRPLPPRRAARRPRGLRPAPGDRAAGGLGDRPGRAELEPAGRRRPVHRFRRDRARGRRRGPGRRASTPSSSTPPRTTGPRRNLAGHRRRAPARRPGRRAFDDLAGTVDVVTCNPPYIPLEAWESVDPEVRDHDPSLALWSGADGLDALRVLERAGRPAPASRRLGRGRARRPAGRDRAGGVHGAAARVGRRTRPSGPAGRSRASSTATTRRQHCRRLP